MASKLQYYNSLAEQKAAEVTLKRGNWTNFLDTAARLYKYPFPEQMMIYAQRPDATSCASIEVWNNLTPDGKAKVTDYDGQTWHRWVRKGSKGIALIDDTGSYPRIKYVFDISDTESFQRNNHRPFVWEMHGEHEAPVMGALAKTYDGVDSDFGGALRNIAEQLSNEYYNDNAREIGYSTAGSFLEDYDEFNLGVAFKEALTVSVAYTLMSRCNVDASEYFTDEDFQCIFDFNTPAMVYALGTAVNDCSKQVLRDIELTIKKYERQQTAERSAEHGRITHLHAGRGLSPAGSDTQRTAEGIDGTTGQVREDAESVPERTQDDNVQHDAAQRDVVPPSAGDGAGGAEPDGADHDGAEGADADTGQGGRPDGLDGGDGQPAEPSGGSAARSGCA